MIDDLQQYNLATRVKDLAVEKRCWSAAHACLGFETSDERLSEQHDESRHKIPAIDIDTAKCNQPKNEVPYQFSKPMRNKKLSNKASKKIDQAQRKLALRKVANLSYHIDVQARACRLFDPQQGTNKLKKLENIIKEVVEPLLPMNVELNYCKFT
ncbi:uncharacterized protein PITG_02838 [Phytophthora infestans T30-4]|uniref:Uncharacterized protein n=1 Tax=Phytophthora infestans (strain T30-4) TaxID=403677 RepID=D0MXC3_PHYIT|nr:uncharacterized protein PITG_02838 [Phytophthora infestans T30-4]EEY64286.1 conserved hypothetical protein [Phytophthora infestans T30-4]|eukprot:XP_002907722.1 conserved hypothetical protein [Phytophthora infestans T30-4]